MAIKLQYLFLPLGFCALFVTAALIPEATHTRASPSLLRKAQCPGNSFQCPTSLGAAFSNVCCSPGQTCALDNNSNPACCPSGAVCTGTAPSGAPTPAPTKGVSYVPNSYFSFPFAATSFDNSAACASARTACSENFDVCTKNLGGGARGGGFGVTVDVPEGGGVTVGGSAQNLGTSATSICSSLSSQACSAVETTQCASFGSGSGTTGLKTPYKVVFVFVAGAGFVTMLLG